MKRFWRISLMLAFLAFGCKKPTPPKAATEKNPSSEERAVQTERTSPSEPAGKAQGANAPRSVKEKKTAADWIPVLQETDAARRIQAAETLGKMRAKEAVPALIALLSDDRSYVRKSAVEALGEIGSDAKNAVAALLARFHDPSTEVRREIVLALSRIDPESKEIIAAFADSLRDPDDSVSQTTNQVLIQIAKSSPPTPVLDPGRRAGGRGHEGALAILQAATAEKNLPLRLRSIGALGEIGTEESVPTLTAAIKQKESAVRKKAVESLAKIGPAAKIVVPALLEALKEVDGDIRHFAVETLAGLGPEAKSAMPALIETLNDRDADVRVQAVRAVVRIDPKAKEVVPALQRLLQDAERDIRLEVLDALGQCGKPAVASLMESLKDLDSNILIHAAESLGRIGPEAQGSLPALQLLLKDDVEEVRNVAAAAIKKIEAGESKSEVKPKN